MSPSRKALYSKACNGDAEAMLFLFQFENYVESIRAFLTSGSNDPQQFIQLMAKSNFVFSCPWYVKHAGVLYLVCQRAIGLILGGEPMNEIVIGVATLRLGFKEAQELVAVSKDVDKAA